MAAEAGAAALGAESVEEALLVWERSGEERGALEGQLLRKMISGLTARVSSVSETLVATETRLASLEELLSAERAARETVAEALRADAADLGERLRSDAQQLVSEACAPLDKGAADLSARVDVMESAWQEALRAEGQSWQQAVRDEEMARHRAHDEVLICLQELRSGARQEAELRSESLGATQAAIASLEAAVGSCNSELSALTSRAEKGQEDLSGLATQTAADREASEASLRQAIAEARAALEDSLGMLGAESRERIDGFGQRMDERLAAVGAEAGELAGRVADMKTSLQAQVLEEIGAVQTAREALEEKVQGLALALQEETAERRVSVEQVTSVAAEAASREVSVVSASVEAHGRALEELSAQLREEAAMHGRAADAARCVLDVLRGEVAAEREARAAAAGEAERGLRAESEARSQWAADLEGKLAASALAQHEEARGLVEQCTAELRAERGAALAELQGQCRELVEAAFGGVSAQVASQSHRVDELAIDLRQALAKVSIDCRGQCDERASAMAEQVKTALDAHGDLAEELQREHLALVDKVRDLNEELSKECKERCAVDSRARAVERDMQRVRIHLPLAFLGGG